MTYAEIRDSSLKLINRYSIMGQEIAPTYNQQQDYIYRIPELINDALMTISTTVKKIPARVQLDMENAENSNGMCVFHLPSDCWQIKPAGLLILHKGHARRYSGYVKSGNTLLVPAHIKGDVWLEYWRYPDLLTTAPADEDDLDGDIDVQMCIPYYVGAHLMQYDDPFLYSSLLNEWEMRIARLSMGVHLETAIVEDVYFWGGERDYGELL